MQEEAGASLSTAGATPEVRRGPSARHLAWVAATAALAYAADQVTKAWAAGSLADGRPRDLVGSLLKLQLTYNPGAAFSLGTNSTLVITAVALAVVVALLVSARKLRSAPWAVAFGLIIGGALGNLTDRFFRSPGGGRGHVVDFLQLPHWPIFNIADSAICCAAALIVVLTFRGIGLDGRRADDTRHAGVAPAEAQTTHENTEERGA